MSRSKILLICLSLGVAQGVTAMSVLKKTAVLSGGAIVPMYMDQKYEQAYREITPLLPDAKLLPSWYTKAVLLKYCPQDRDLIMQIDFKKSETMRSLPTKRGPIMFITKDVHKESDALVLHEYGHIKNGDADISEFFTKFKCGILSAGAIHHLLHASGKKRFLVAPVGVVAGNQVFSIVGNVIKHEQEKRADQFTLDCLKAQGSTKDNFKQIRKAISFFDTAAFKEDRVISIVSAEGDAIDKCKFAALKAPDYIRAQVDVHPAPSKRADKFVALLDELKAKQKIKE